jgi:hypothetical protein
MYLNIPDKYHNNIELIHSPILSCIIRFLSLFLFVTVYNISILKILQLKFILLF